MSGPDLQRWSHEVAEDPGAPAFVPLARAYRRQGRRPAALNVVLRGLERDPQNVEGHALLALLHVDTGERERAGDEWETILRLDPGNFDAHRGLGFLALERNDLDDARRHLEAAADARPEDPAVRQAREVLRRREQRVRAAAAESTSAADAAAPSEPAGPAGVATVEEAPPVAPVPASPPSPSADGAGAGGDPALLFDALSAEQPFLGALLLDARGLVLGGSMPEGRGEMLGAMLNSTVAEARRATRLLALGRWDGVFLECDDASLHVASIDDGLVVVVAVRPGTPAGWLVRAAGTARTIAQRFLEAGP